MDEKERFEPWASELGTPFWEATRSGRLVLPWCGSCGRPHWYPRSLCPHCRSDDLEWRDARGTGSIYALSVQHRPGWPGLAGCVPYAVALVELDEGVRMLSNIVGAEPTGLTIGQDVTIAWEDLSDGRKLPVFEPAG